jgi:polysaccharide biosynthesis protein PslG
MKVDVPAGQELAPRGLGSRRGSRLVAVCAVAAALVLLPAAGAAAAVPKTFVGIVSEDVFAGDADYRTANLSAQSAIGIGLIRQTFNWSEIEKAPGQYDFSAYDAYVGAAAAHGITILPILFKPPAFRSPNPGARFTYPPKQYRDLGVFGAAVIRRYGANGSYWTQNPGVPKLPFRSVQVWNEPNLRQYWPPQPNPEKFTKLLKAAAKPIKAADRSVEIVTAGLPQSGQSRPSLLKYVERMYKSGAKSAFDTLAINTYARNDRELVTLLKNVRRLMNKYRDRRAKIWATELGWSDTGPASPFRAGVGGQADRIKKSFKQLRRFRTKLGIRGVVYYSWRDGAPYPPQFRDFWGLHTGLLKRDGSVKPAFNAFKQAVSALR